MTKKKISVDVDGPIAKWVDDPIKLGLFRNLSHLLKEAPTNMKQEGTINLPSKKVEET